MNTDYEEWDYKISGKTSGIASIVFGFVMSAVLVAITVDQLLPQPNKSKIVALFFGFAAAPILYSFIVSLIRYVCFRVYIGKKGFYFQSNPFNGKYYLYSDIVRCYEHSERFRHNVSKCYFFNFTDKNGKTVKFTFEKNINVREIKELKERIDAEL